MFEIGRICVKIAGRDARLKCVVIDVMDKGYVLIDGQTRRRKCNTLHLEPLGQVIKIKKGASTKEVHDEFKKLKIEVKEQKPKNAAARPRKHRAEKPAAEKPAKKTVKEDQKDAGKKAVEKDVTDSKPKEKKSSAKQPVKKVVEKDVADSKLKEKKSSAKPSVKKA